MATIKSYTDISQSRKLSEILSLESADQTWARIAIAGANLDVPEELQYRHNGDMPFQYYSGIGIPCWSLAALFGVLPDNYIDVDDIIKHPSLMETKDSRYMVIYSAFQYTSLYNNPVDACVAMILKLHELNLL